MAKGRDASYEKGRSDERHHSRESQRGGIGHAVSDAVNPDHRPPSENREAYKAGWRDSERDRKR